MADDTFYAHAANNLSDLAAGRPRSTRSPAPRAPGKYLRSDGTNATLANITRRRCADPEPEHDRHRESARHPVLHRQRHVDQTRRGADRVRRGPRSRRGRRVRGVRRGRDRQSGGAGGGAATGGAPAVRRVRPHLQGHRDPLRHQTAARPSRAVREHAGNDGTIGATPLSGRTCCHRVAAPGRRAPPGTPQAASIYQVGGNEPRTGAARPAPEAPGRLQLCDTDRDRRRIRRRDHHEPGRRGRGCRRQSVLSNDSTGGTAGVVGGASPASGTASALTYGSCGPSAGSGAASTTGAAQAGADARPTPGRAARAAGVAERARPGPGGKGGAGWVLVITQFQ